MRYLAATLLSLTAVQAQAAVSYLKCDVQTVLHRPAPHNTDITHVENRYTKYFKLDDQARMVSLFNERRNTYTPVCSEKNQACQKSWNGQDISLDARGAADDPLPPYLDFRRAFKLSNGGKTVNFIIADYGQSADGKANMYWSYDGSCAASDEPKAMARGPGVGAPNIQNPKYEKPTSPALPISKAEQDKILAGYYGSTMWGFSGGGHWFRMWFLDRNGLAYTSDDQDMSSEHEPHQWYFGKDSTGYRICRDPIPAAGREGCYPLLIKKVGDAWVEHDMDGDADFRLDAGRQ
jgi:hypothetical protein